MPTLITMTAATMLLAFSASKPPPVLIWNMSESVPVGLYVVLPDAKPSVTTLVAAFPPEPLATLLADGGYLPRDVPLLKRVLALPGQSVCRNDLLIIVDGITMGAARAHDSRGRKLPAWQGCRILADGELFLMNWDEPKSFDGRYFGPIPLSAIVGRAQPLWTFEND